MITLKEKEALVRANIETQRILNSLPVKKECVSCEFWDNTCNKHAATPPDEVQANGCGDWQEKDYIPF